MNTLFWLVVLWLVLRRLAKWGHRYRAKHGLDGARSSTAPNKAVSRNPQSGPKWEQDAPMPECFDEQEDDL